jgi:hypothetical protein
MNMSTESTKPRRKRKRRIGLIILFVFLVICFFGWISLNSIVKSKIASQLVAAGIDSPKVGSVRIGLDGIVAREIQFEAAEGVQVQLSKLTVKQSIFELASGDTPMDGIILDGGELLIDSSKVKSGSSFSLSDLELDEVSLPADRIAVNNFLVRIFDEDGEVVLNIAETELTEQDGGFVISGLTKTLDGELQFDGRIAKSSGDIDIEFDGLKLHFVDQQWQKWPKIPPSVLKHLGADAVADVSGVIDGNLKTGVKYLADIDTKDARLYIPKFDLPIAVRMAKVRIQDGLVTYKEVVAAMGDGDVVNGTGTTTIAGLPCRSKFQGDFENVDVADLRQLVKQIPLKVVGTATGSVVGSVDVNHDLETTLRIDAKGDTKSASYGEIHATTGNVDVQIQPLVLTKNGKTIDLQGGVTVKAATTEQNVDGVLATFDLQALDRQFEFELLGDGEVDLLIPLNSAADLRTWSLNVDSVAKSASVGGMQLQNLELKTYLEDGLLVFEPAKAILSGDEQATVAVSVKWPLPNRAAKSIVETGVVEVTGENIPPDEALKFFDRQMKNANVEYKFEPQVESLAASPIGGELSFASSIKLPAANDRPIDSWDVEANVFDSAVDLSDAKLKQLCSDLTIKGGVLQVKDLEGDIEGGGHIKAGARLSLASSEISDVSLNGSQFPAAWLARSIMKLDSSGEFTRRTGLSSGNVAEKLTGVFDATIKMDPKQANKILWDATSDQLEIFGKPFRSVAASGIYDADFSIREATTKLPGGGRATMVGDWVPGNDSGELVVQWDEAALVPLLENLISLPDSVSSSSTGKINVSFDEGRPNFSGRFDLVEPKAFGGTFADHHFKVKTDVDRIQFEDIPFGKQNGIELKGSFDRHYPFSFEVAGKARSMPLSTAMFDQLSGSATANFKVEGNASPWKLKSTGEAEVVELVYRDASLSDIKSRWAFDTSQNTQQLTINGLGGQIELDTASSLSDDLVFKLKKLELADFAAFRKLPAKLSGIVSGSLTIGNWRSPNERTIVATGSSKAMMVDGVRLSRVQGNAILKEGGQQVEYSLNSQLLDGKLEISGATKIASAANPFSSAFPVNVRLTNARMSKFAESISKSPIKAMRQLQGRISLGMDWEVTPGQYPQGVGKVSLEDAKWKNRLVSRRIYSDISLNDGIMQLKNIHADLQQGEISGRATIPLVGSASGSYELDVRNFSLKRMIDVLLDDPINAHGQVNAKISGRTGRTITGSGRLGLSRAGLFGVANQSMKLPIRFRIEPSQRTVRIEMPRNRFRAFQGNVNGSASLDIGSRVRLESKLELSNIDSQSLIRSLTGYTNTGSGKLSGRLELSGKNIRTQKDLTGAFRGKLKQSTALAFPLLDQLSGFLGSSASLRNDQFNSDAIDLALSKGRINVRQFRLQNRLASIAVTGDAWLDGRLDMEVAARIERLDQPTLVDQLAGSPLARISSPEVAFFAEAAEFLSERIVFVDVGGTTQRPQLRLNPGKQLKEEAIRYFLRGSQILPNANGRNN